MLFINDVHVYLLTWFSLTFKEIRILYAEAAGYDKDLSRSGSGH